MASVLYVPDDEIRPLKRREFDHLIAAGLFDEDDRVELLDGQLVRMNPPGPAHASIVDRLTQALVVAVGDRAVVRVQNPLALSEESQPEPDLCVVPNGDYDDHHPSEALLVIEVASTSVRKDRETKGRLYARAGVPEYWLVSVSERVVEVHRHPFGDAYRDIHRISPTGELQTQAFTDVRIPVSRILR